MKILQKYLMREYIMPFLFGVLIFTFIFIASKMVYLVNLIINKGVNPFVIIKLLYYSLPSIMILSIPMGVLIANILSVGKLSSENEITAIKSSGINLMSVLSPLILAGLLISALLMLSYNTFLPAYNTRFMNQVHILSNSQPALELQEHAFNDIGNYRIYIYRVNPRTSILEDLIISEIKAANSKYITARTGKLLFHPDGLKLTLQLSNGAIHQTDENDKNRYQVLGFNVHNMTINLPSSYNGTRQKGLDEMTSAEVIKEIYRYKKTGIDANPLIIELYKRFSLPFACLSFTLIGIPMGLRARHRSKSISFGISAMIIFGYYLVMVVGETMAVRQMVPALLAIWMPNIIFTVLGSVMFAKSIK